MTLEEKGKVATKDQFLSSIKGKRSPPLEKRGILQKALIRYPVARGKHALEPSRGFNNTEPNCIPCSWRSGRAGRKENSSLPLCLRTGKEKLPHNFPVSCRASSYLWLHTDINTDSFTDFPVCTLLQRYPYHDEILP